ncbi:MAG TPA: glycosyltransferase N-terminal domain-containing protein [Ferruginibacter sp.]|nr:glycosyltransferase N-terminal domain-containing protein [Ferruginibacter sp.]
MSIFFYNIFLGLYLIGVRLLSFWNPKAKLWLSGRKKFPAITVKPGSSVVWMHCASLGEFEQGRPVLESVKDQYPTAIIILTFFSPSGYEVQKNYKGADHVFYLPMDSAANAKKFIDAIQPTLVLWVKYEYWFYYLAELQKRNIPTLLISGIFREGQPFFKWYGSMWKKVLGAFTHFFVQNEASVKLLSGVGVIANVSISGDTRFDRVIAIAEKFEPVAGIEEFCGDSQVIVAGSTWEDDEAELVHYVKANANIKFIIAPHEIGADNLKVVKAAFPNAIFYSELLELQEKGISSNCLIIDNIGMLSRLYKYADITYVGGAFGEGLHNILEAAVYGKPILFGPDYDKYAEAVDLIDRCAAISINNALELEEEFIYLLTNADELAAASKEAKDYVYAKKGATEKISRFIYENRLLTI